MGLTAQAPEPHPPRNKTQDKYRKMLIKLPIVLKNGDKGNEVLTFFAYSYIGRDTNTRMNMAQPVEEALPGDDTQKHLPRTLPEVQVMLRIIAWLGWINLLIGLPSVLLVMNLRSLSLVATGLLSILTFWLLRMIVKHITHTKSWPEVGVLVMCGVYFPTFIMWTCATNLIEAIVR
jgi:hypothetical protein